MFVLNYLMFGEKTREVHHYNIEVCYRILSLIKWKR